MALRFAKRGAKISLTDVNFESVQSLGSINMSSCLIVYAWRLENQMKEKGFSVKAIHCDVSSVESVKKCAEIAKESLGEVDILINNAGIVSGKEDSGEQRSAD